MTPFTGRHVNLYITLNNTLKNRANECVEIERREVAESNDGVASRIE